MNPTTVADAARALRSVLESAPGRLARISEEEAGRPRAPGKWSRKQVLGHLIDSASNNHQRFVRASLQGELKFPPYDGDAWVDVQGYADRPWARIVALWTEYNLQVLHLIEHLPAAKHGAPCVVEAASPVTLEFLMRDYVQHLEHHLEQIFEPPR